MWNFKSTVGSSQSRDRWEKRINWRVGQWYFEWKKKVFWIEKEVLNKNNPAEARAEVHWKQHWRQVLKRNTKN